MNRLSYRSTLSPAQRTLTAQIRLSSERAVVLSIATGGVQQDFRGIPFFKLTVETMEEPGHPTTLKAWASLSKGLSELQVGDVISFDGTAEGTMYRPVVVLSSFQEL
jgi:hypothetical protein